jgi:phytoene dehydrogenase-like protein
MSADELTRRYDAVVVGSGPNGLAAAIMLARAGQRVLVLEASSTFGGGLRSADLTLPGFVHDVCSAIHPLGRVSPFLRTLPLAEHGLRWIDPPVACAHPFDDGTAALLQRSVAATGATLDGDAARWRALFVPLVRRWPKIEWNVLGPLRVPRHPVALGLFGLHAIRSAHGLARVKFKGERARALFAGCAAHAIMPLEHPLTAAFGLLLATSAHLVGWPFPEGGAQRLADALVSYLRALGGEVRTGVRVTSLSDIPATRTSLFDLAPRQILAIMGERFPAGYRARLERYRYGPGAFKVDWALRDAVPWTAPGCADAGTLHLGGTIEEVAASERAMWRGSTADRPFVLVAQQSRFDASRAPTGQHTLWGYCHVPNGSTEDMTARIEAQIERFAPGFRDLILQRHVMAPADWERYNPNYVGGDINGGVQDAWQLFTRPVARLVPYTTPLPNVFICSSSTPPGGGVHGMGGYWAARAALRVLGDPTTV